jgi:hypothetical protein
MGVKNAIPAQPNFCLIFIPERDILLNFFGGVFLKENFPKKLLKNTTNKTISIIPIIEQSKVSSQLSFRAKPVNGPPINFNILTAITEKYFVKLIPISII